jgi:hypothetical protein
VYEVRTRINKVKVKIGTILRAQDLLAVLQRPEEYRKMELEGLSEEEEQVKHLVSFVTFNRTVHIRH